MFCKAMERGRATKWIPLIKSADFTVTSPIKCVQVLEHPPCSTTCKQKHTVQTYRDLY